MDHVDVRMTLEELSTVCEVLHGVAPTTLTGRRRKVLEQVRQELRETLVVALEEDRQYG